MPSSQVALIQGSDRYNNIRQALDRIDSNIDLSSIQRLLIKPNFVSPHKPLSVTHVDATRAVLDYVRARYDGPITIAEGPARLSADEAFRLHGYEPLAQEYDATLLDLNHDETVPVQVHNWRLRPLKLRLARTVVESDYRISIGPPKTHDVVIVTMSLKNMVMGSIISSYTHGADTDSENGNGRKLIIEDLRKRVPNWVYVLPPVEWLASRIMTHLFPSDKTKMHQGYPIMNLNLALVAPHVKPHLSVIDGFEAMEGDGPTSGTPVSLRLALTSTDALAADVTAATLMGFDVDQVGYLSYCRQMGLGCGDLSHIEIVGNATLAECTRSFRPHFAYHRQLQWHLPQAAQYLPSGPSAT